jgi:phosphoserine aminotransferase
MLGPVPVDVLAWESFGKDWATDITKQLKLKDVRVLSAPYGKLPDLTQVNPKHDVVFTWNGTTSGVRVPNGHWIADDRVGLTICDATSAAFAQDLPWTKLDVVTFSWQKALGGEAAHGVLVLSPNAVKRLEAYTPHWPLPKIFRMTNNGKLNEGIFKGETINTPSMLCVEDWIDTLKWAEGVGGLTALMGRANANLAAVERFVRESKTYGFLAEDEKFRSNTSVCLSFVDPWFAQQPAEKQADIAKKVADLLEKEGVALDIGGYRDAPAGLRVWCGATVERADVEALLPWLEFAYQQVKTA